MATHSDDGPYCRDALLGLMHTCAGLTSLQSLDLNNTQVSDLQPLTGLPELREIGFAGGGQVTEVVRNAFLAERKRLGLPAVRIIHRGSGRG